MQKQYSASIFPSILSYEEFEEIKQKKDMVEKAANEIVARHKLPQDPISYFEDGTNIVFSLGENRIIKIFPPIHVTHFENEVLVLKHLYGQLSISTPLVEYEGEIDGWPYIVMSKLEGTLLEKLWEKMGIDNKIIIIRELGALISEVHSLSTKGLEPIDCHWEQFIKNQINHCVKTHQLVKLPEKFLQQIPTYLKSVEQILPIIKKPVLLTGEYTPMNLIVKEVEGIWHIDGMIDFGDAMLGLPEYDLLGPGAFLIHGDKFLLSEFLKSYGYSEKEITPRLSRQLTLLMLLHRYSNLEVQLRIKDWKDNINSLEDLESLVWGFN